MVFPGTGEVHPFLYDGNTMADLTPGGAATAYGINAQDQVVGSGGNRAFLSSTGTTTHLMDLIDPGTGWIQLRDAWALNDTAEIVGSGVINGQLHGFLMTPR
jgi:uncharacterized membrane protein